MESENKYTFITITKQDFYDKTGIWWDVTEDSFYRGTIRNTMGLVFLSYKFSVDTGLIIRFIVSDYKKYFLAKIKYGF